tara:strand:- start:81 stop:401 length:321 start_codon:yes stop_codon:yes gene_type:complete
MRYKYTKRKLDKETNNRILSVTHYPKITPKNSDIIYYTRFDDTFMRLAYTYYGDQSLWWIIARANAPFKGNTKFTPGSKIIIPIEYQDFLNEFNRLNSIIEIEDNE